MQYVMVVVPLTVRSVNSAGPLKVQWVMVALCGDIGEVAAESEAGVGEGGVGREDGAG